MSWQKRTATVVAMAPNDLLRELNPGLRSFDTWLAEHKDDLPRAGATD